MGEDKTLDKLKGLARKESIEKKLEDFADSLSPEEQQELENLGGNEGDNEKKEKEDILKGALNIFPESEIKAREEARKKRLREAKEAYKKMTPKEHIQADFGFEIDSTKPSYNKKLEVYNQFLNTTVEMDREQYLEYIKKVKGQDLSPAEYSKWMDKNLNPDKHKEASGE